MNERDPKIRVACCARDPYFRYLFANCISPKNKNPALEKAQDSDSHVA